MMGYLYQNIRIALQPHDFKRLKSTHSREWYYITFIVAADNPLSL